MRRLLLLSFALACLVAPAGAHAANGDFLIGCGYDHTATDDPIVHFGMPGASHSHDFAGAIGVTAFTTSADLGSAGSLCNPPGDASAYWAPSVIKNGALVHYNSLDAYYRADGATKSGPSKLHPFPFGLKHVQGDPNNTNPSHYAVTYRCYSGGTTSVYLPANCNGSGFEESIYFWECWNGAELDNATHHTLGPCGSSYPIRVPQLQYLINWPPEAVGGQLSSDPAGTLAPGITGHADFFDGWDEHLQDEIVQKCLLANISCRSNANGDIRDFGTQAIVIPAGT